MAPKRAYATLITRSSYLAGVIILAYTLRKHGSKYPLVVLYTSSLNAESIKALQLEGESSGIIPRETEPLLPSGEVSLIAERFADTWTKLRVFELLDFDEVCYLDADMTINNRNMDDVFDNWMPPAAGTAPCREGAGEAEDWLAASHCCVCNLDHDAWAPKGWVPENCPFTHTTHPAALKEPTPIGSDSPAEYDLLNGGLFLFRPSSSLWSSMLNTFKTWGSNGKLKTFKFPDQDFLAEFFRGRWRPVPWCFNALKTWRYWHENIWRDDEVVCLHYIVDKPWTKRVGSDGKAGYKGDDGETHKWWWNEWEAWLAERRASGKEEVASLVSGYVAGGGNEEGFNAIGGGVQDFAKKQPNEQRQPKPTDTQRIKPQWDLGVGEDGVEGDPLKIEGREVRWQNKPLAERGHGPVVRKHPPANE